MHAIQGGRVSATLDQVETGIDGVLQHGVVLGIFVEAQDEPRLPAHEQHVLPIQQRCGAGQGRGGDKRGEQEPAERQS